jgi:hypothetical protein
MRGALVSILGLAIMAGISGLLLNTSACTEIDSESSTAASASVIKPACSAVSETLEESWQLALDRTKQAYNKHSGDIKNTRRVAVINYVTTNDSSDRLRLYDPSADWKQVGSYWVSHATKSDAGYSESIDTPEFNNCATNFSNKSGSNLSSKGAFVTAEGKGQSSYGRENLRLHGKDAELNSNAHARDIVFHQALQEGEPLGYSLGCPMLRPEDLDPVLDAIVGGALLYVHQE